MSQKQKFLCDWLSNLMENMDSHLDEKTKVKILEECGRACAKNHAKDIALKFEGNLTGWLGQMKKWVGSENIKRDKNRIEVRYSKCLCPLVKNISSLFSRTYCHCSRGWLKENFETVVQKPVEVELVDSIMMGGKQCRFQVFLD